MKWLSFPSSNTCAKEAEFFKWEEQEGKFSEMSYLPHQRVVIVGFHFTGIHDLASKRAVSSALGNTRTFAEDAVMQNASYQCLPQGELCRAQRINVVVADLSKTDQIKG